MGLRRIILHIGSPKTGTTSLQFALAGFRAQLDKAGVLYPVLGKGAQHHPVSLLARYDAPPRMLAQKQTETDAERLQRGQASLDQISRQIDPVRHHTLILSSECLFAGISPDRGAMFLDRLRLLAPQIDVICYVRDPLGFFLSQTGQGLRASHVLPVVEAPDYLSSLAAYETADSIALAQYEQAIAHEGGLITDFFVRARLNIPPSVQAERHNVSLSAEALDILWRYRSQIHPDKADIFRPDTKRLIQHLQQVDPQIEGDRRLRAQTRVAETIRAGFIPQQAILRDRYGVELAGPDAANALPDPWYPKDLAQIVEIDPERRARLEIATTRALLRTIARALR